MKREATMPDPGLPGFMQRRARPCPVLVNTSVIAGPHSLLVLRDARDVMLTLRWGRIWITLERDPSDYILSAGDRMCFASRRPVLLEAWRTSRIDCAARPGSGFRIERAAGSLCLLEEGERQSWPSGAARCLEDASC